MIDLDAIGADLRQAYGRRVARRLRIRRIARVGGVAVSLAAVFSAVAIASGIGPDLQLDPTKWSILGGGSVDNGRGSYVHATRTSDGSHSTFMVEHDAGLTPYRAFLLHERVRAAADESSPVPVRTERGELCTADELTRAESAALDALRAQRDPDAVVAAAFADAPCRGLEYATERARAVLAGTEPDSMLMPGAR